MSYWFSLVFPWLLVFWGSHALTARLKRAGGKRVRGCFKNRSRRREEAERCAIPSRNPPPQVGGYGAWAIVTWGTLVCLAVGSAVVVLLPFQGITLGRWVAGLNFTPSIPLLALLAGRIWKNVFQTEVFRPTDTRTALLFGALIGTALYPLSLGLGDFDPYEWGWSFSVLFPLIALVTIFLIWKQNRFGLLLFLASAAYDARCLESPNLWDYLVDPVYWLLSVVLLTISFLKKINRLRAGHPVELACNSVTAK